MFMVLGATLSTNYDTFTIFRSLQGLFGTVPQVIGLPIIHDMYSPEGKSLSLNLFYSEYLVTNSIEWPRMINIW